MLNWILATIAAALWSTAYGWYFAMDLRRWAWRRRHRKQLAEIERARAYAAWMRRTTPPRGRPGYAPSSAPRAAPEPAVTPRPSGIILPFPPRGQRPPPG